MRMPFIRWHAKFNYPQISRCGRGMPASLSVPSNQSVFPTYAMQRTFLSQYGTPATQLFTYATIFRVPFLSWLLVFAGSRCFPGHRLEDSVKGREECTYEVRSTPADEVNPTQHFRGFALRVPCSS